MLHPENCDCNKCIGADDDFELDLLYAEQDAYDDEFWEDERPWTDEDEAGLERHEERKRERIALANEY